MAFGSDHSPGRFQSIPNYHETLLRRAFDRLSDESTKTADTKSLILNSYSIPDVFYCLVRDFSHGCDRVVSDFPDIAVNGPD